MGTLKELLSNILNYFEIIFILLIFIISSSIIYYYNYIDQIYIWDLKSFLLKTPTYFMPTLFISILAFYIASKNFLRKTGSKVSASISYASSSTSKESYFSNIVLVNKKDKPLIIHGIYLRLGRNIFIKLKEYNLEYLTLKPYETLVVRIAPHYAYYCSLYWINPKQIMDLYMDKNVKTQIVLDSFDGIVYCANLKKDVILSKFFENQSTIHVDLHEGNFINDVPVGNNVLYHVEMKNKFGNSWFQIYSNDKDSHSYLNGKLVFSNDDLKDIATVEKIIKRAVENGELDWSDIKVNSMQFELDYYSDLKKRNEEEVELSRDDLTSIFSYYLIGPIRAHYRDYKIKKENKAIKQIKSL